MKFLGRIEVGLLNWSILIVTIGTIWVASLRADCCGDFTSVVPPPPAAGVCPFTPTNTPTVTPTPTFTPTATNTIPTPTATPTPTPVTCQFSSICDSSALSSVNDSSNGETYNWVNPQAAHIIDTSSAGGTDLGNEQTSKYLNVFNYAGASGSGTGGSAACVNTQGVNLIPDNAVILGVTILIRRCGHVAQGDVGVIKDAEIRMSVGGTLSSDNKALNDTWGQGTACGDSDRTYGGPNDTWGFGGILRGTDLKDQQFGFVLSAKATLGKSAPSVDGIAITQVCYNPNP